MRDESATDKMVQCLDRATSEMEKILEYMQSPKFKSRELEYQKGYIDASMRINGALLGANE